MLRRRLGPLTRARPRPVVVYIRRVPAGLRAQHRVLQAFGRRAERRLARGGDVQSASVPDGRDLAGTAAQPLASVGVAATRVLVLPDQVLSTPPVTHIAIAALIHDSHRGNAPSRASRMHRMIRSWPTRVPTPGRCVQIDTAGAVAALLEAVEAARAGNFCSATSGVVRVEARVPAAFTALQWLLAQGAGAAVSAGMPAAGGAEGAGPLHGTHGVYFSPRRVPYPASDALGLKPAVAGATYSPCASLLRCDVARPCRGA